MQAKTCWVLTVGVPGMDNQSIGLAQALGLEVVQKRIQPVAPWKHLLPQLWLAPLRFLGPGSDAIEPPWPDVVIGTGRLTVAVALAIKRASGGRTFNIRIQDPHTAYDEFDVIVTPQHDRCNHPNVIPTLIKLKAKGLKLAIVSDAPRINAWIRLHELKIADFFDAVVAFGDVEERKPSKLPFEKALTTLKLKPEQVLMVGDWPERDMNGAKALGMKSCFAKYGYVLEEKPKIKADYTLEDFSDLLKIIKK